MATRLLLTLLALLTGLAAPAASAQARVCGQDEAEIGAIESALDAVAVAVRVAETIVPSAAYWAVDVAVSGFTATYPTVLAPAVLMGIDRARE